MEILGIDIGGSGIKGTLVDTEKGAFAVERHRIDTPQPSIPENVAGTVAEIVNHFDYTGPIGCTFPAVIRHGVAMSAANVDKSWIGTNAELLFTEKTGFPVRVLNDGDAAGIAEMTHGVGQGQTGVAIMLTLGTGIGSAIFTNGVLLPNTEFGHVQMKGMDAEHYASSQVRKQEDLSWKKWGLRVNEYLQYMEMLFTPDLFILGGGVSKKSEKFLEYIDVQAEVVPAQLLNDAGIIGAAMAAVELV
ncbi:MAG: ROK family protein [Chloroflexota bacterium]